MKNQSQKFSIIDIETTGSLRKGQRIIEIAIINIDDSEIVEEFSSFINPEIPIPQFITNLTGISNNDVVIAPKFFQVAKKIVEMTEGRIFVAHNVFFDFNFIRHEFSELGFMFSREKLCTVQLARKHLPGMKSYSLGQLAKDLSIPHPNAHRAMGDAKTTYELFKIIQKKITLNNDLIFGSSEIALPPLLDRENFKSLPQAMGVYYFYNIHGDLLYVGKSVNIKKRVAQHFHPDLKKRKDIELKNQIAKIHFKLFPHELAALIFECMEIKKHFPRYNLSLKRRKFPYALRLKLNDLGIYEILCAHNDGSFHPLFSVKSKKAGVRRIDNIYTNILGPYETSFERESKIQLLVNKLGVLAFNELVEKIFYQKIPKTKDFELPLAGNKFIYGFIRIQNYSPIEMIIKDQDHEESIYQLDPDPDIASIVYRYAHKLDAN